MNEMKGRSDQCELIVVRVGLEDVDDYILTLSSYSIGLSSQVPGRHTHTQTQTHTTNAQQQGLARRNLPSGTDHPKLETCRTWLAPILLDCSSIVSEPRPLSMF